MIRDWAHGAHTSHFPPLSGVDLEPAMSRLTTPVLAISIEKDQYTPQPTMDHVLGKLPAAAIARQHVDAGSDHFSWARELDHPIATAVTRFATTQP